MIRLFLFCALCFVGSTELFWLTDTEHDFGMMEQGTPQIHVFQFKNTTTDSIRVEAIRTTCGCTAPTWTAEAIAPDSVGTINVEYDAQRAGYFKKKVKVFFNHQRKAEILLIEGYVE